MQGDLAKTQELATLSGDFVVVRVFTYHRKKYGLWSGLSRGP